MARRQRIYFPGAYYHVILRGNDRQDIFYDKVDRYNFYLLLLERIERFGHSILSFCLMTNHVHLICQVSDVPLSRIVQDLAFRYTRWINWRQNRVGHLFQGRYKANLVDADEYLLQFNILNFASLTPAFSAKDLVLNVKILMTSHLGVKGERPWPTLKSR
jgi:putative transposase